MRVMQGLPEQNSKAGREGEPGAFKKPEVQKNQLPAPLRGRI